MQVLVVEDDIAIGEPLATGLRREGFVVTLVQSAAAALSAPPADIVLLDLGLPDAHGFEVCRQLRARSTVPIIIVT
ncbi:MAG: response regulator, partial [Acidimicrobiales bacterium]